MSNSSQTTTTTSAVSSTTVGRNTTSNDTVDTTRAPSTTISVTFASTTLSPTNSSSHSSVGATEPNKSDAHYPAIIGGCAGVVILIIVVALFIICKRRKSLSNRSSTEIIVPPPSAEALHNIELQKSMALGDKPKPVHKHTDIPKPKPHDGAVDAHHYTNLTGEGGVNEDTDPALGPDGYIKKTGAKVKPQPIPSHRTSMPMEKAPPIPQNVNNPDTIPEERGSYVIGRTANITNSPYVNLKKQKKGSPVFGVAPKPNKSTKPVANQKAGSHKTKPKQHNKATSDYYNERQLKQDTQEGKLYANLNQDNGNSNNPNYYNTADKVNNAIINEVFYEDPS